MIVIVTGGRDYADATMVRAVLHELQPDEVWHGGARGADALAAAYPFAHTVEFPAFWKEEGRKAGPRRNQRMIDAGKRAWDFSEDLVYVVAFPGGRGTADCVRRARKAGLAVIDVTEFGWGAWQVTLRDEHGIELRNVDQPNRVLSVSHSGKDARDIGSVRAVASTTAPSEVAG